MTCLKENQSKWKLTISMSSKILPNNDTMARFTLQNPKTP